MILPFVRSQADEYIYLRNRRTGKFDLVLEWKHVREKLDSLSTVMQSGDDLEDLTSGYGMVNFLYDGTVTKQVTTDTSKIATLWSLDTSYTNILSYVNTNILWKTNQLGFGNIYAKDGFHTVANGTLYNFLAAGYTCNITAVSDYNAIFGNSHYINADYNLVGGSVDSIINGLYNVQWGYKLYVNGTYNLLCANLSSARSGSYNFITGQNNEVTIGDYNKVAGDHNTVASGYYNNLSGRYITTAVNSDYNLVDGEYIDVDGDNNLIKAFGNVSGHVDIQGFGNSVVTRYAVALDTVTVKGNDNCVTGKKFLVNGSFNDFTLNESKVLGSYNKGVLYKSTVEGDFNSSIINNSSVVGSHCITIGTFNDVYKAVGGVDVGITLGDSILNQGDYATFGIGHCDTIADNQRWGGCIGTGLITDSYGNVAVGLWNEDISGSEAAWVATDPIFQVGNGQRGARSDALTIYKNGSMKIGGTGYLINTIGTTAQRPGSPANGMQRYNTTLGKIEFYEGGAWTSYNQTITLSGDVAGSGTTAITTTIQATAVEGSMLNDNCISGQGELTSGLADTDELLVSDAGVLKRMDVLVLQSHLGGVYWALTSKPDADTNLVIIKDTIYWQYGGIRSYTPTLAWGGDTPGGITTVFRYRRDNNQIEFTIDIQGTMGTGHTATSLSITLPVTPKDVNMYVPTSTLVAIDIGGAGKLSPAVAGMYVDADAVVDANRKLISGVWTNWTTETNNRIIIRGFYEAN